MSFDTLPTELRNHIFMYYRSLMFAERIKKFEHKLLFPAFEEWEQSGYTWYEVILPGEREISVLFQPKQRGLGEEECHFEIWFKYSCGCQFGDCFDVSVTWMSDHNSTWETSTFYSSKGNHLQCAKVNHRGSLLSL